MLILLFSPAYFWSNTSGRLIFGEINTFPDLQIIVLVPVMRMMTIHPACRVKLEDASALRKNTASPHFLKNVGFFLETSTMAMWLWRLGRCLNVSAPTSPAPWTLCILPPGTPTALHAFLQSPTVAR